MTTQSTKWTPKKRDYVAEHKQSSKTTTSTTTHPLGVAVIVRLAQVRIASTSFLLPFLGE